MNLFVGVTDYNWFQLHQSKSQLVEVNFWRPSPEASFKALNAGELFLFKLHSPRNFIVGGGFFTRFVHLPISISWEAFGEGNGVRSLAEMRERIAKYSVRQSKSQTILPLVAYCSRNHSFSAKRSGFPRLLTLASILSRGRDTTAKMALPAGTFGKL
jgi:hypothetical protein